MRLGSEDLTTVPLRHPECRLRPSLFVSLLTGLDRPGQRPRRGKDTSTSPGCPASAPEEVPLDVHELQDTAQS